MSAGSTTGASSGVEGGPLHKATPEQPDDEAFFPPRPDPKLAPKQFELWNEIVNRKPKLVSARNTPNFEVGLDETRNWSGAVLPARDRNTHSLMNASTKPSPFTLVRGSWVIPNPQPLMKDQSYVDGNYRLYSYIGLDGWQNEVALKIGVESGFKVDKGKIENKYHQAAILFRGPKEQPMSYHLFNKSFVEPGDLITAYVWIMEDGHAGWGTIFNEAKNIYASGKVKAPKDDQVPGGVVVKGQSGEWIVAAKNPGTPPPHDYRFPHYGATVFFNGLVTRNDKTEQSMGEAMLADAEDADSFAQRKDEVLMYSGWEPVQKHRSST